MQRRLHRQLVEREARELLGAGLGVARGGEGQACVAGGAGDEQQAYKLPKMSCQREADGSSDGAAEWDAGEGGGAETARAACVDGDGDGSGSGSGSGSVGETEDLVSLQSENWTKREVVRGGGGECRGIGMNRRTRRRY